MPAKVYSAALIGLETQIIEVEVDLAPGLHSFNIVGLPDTAVQESKQRVSSAIKNSGASPANRHNRRVTVNLAPADLKKEGPSYDLPIAISYLLASNQVGNFETKNKLFLGELGLEGQVRSVNGALSIAIAGKKFGFDTIILPKTNAREAALVNDLKVIGVESLKELMSYLEGKIEIKPFTNQETSFPTSIYAENMAYIKGQEQAKRVLEIAAAGGHNVLMSGPPGSGKTLLARALPSILPAMDFEEALEVTQIYSVAGLLPKSHSLITERPFRSPHHTASGVALVGGGTWPKPGEISLAHRGVLFLDEIPQFQKSTLENLRQPLEDGFITVSRVQSSVTFPAKFILIASMNPCPCGYANDPQKECRCTPSQISQYQRKISGPLLDRIDLQIEVPWLPYESLSSEKIAEDSDSIRRRIEKARLSQKNRFGSEEKSKKIFTNAEMPIPQIKQYCRINETSQALLKNAVSKYHLSGRAFHRLLKIARTIADLDNKEEIETNHLAEAIQYRIKEEV